jgi:hypothetical protein
MPKESVIRKKIIKILEEQGFVCWYAPKVKFRTTDVFGIVDLLALRGRQRKNIQLTTLPNVSAKRKKITAFLKKHKVEFPVEIWAWNQRKKNFKKERINLKIKKKRRGKPR